MRGVLQAHLDPRTLVVTRRIGGLVGNAAVAELQPSITTLRPLPLNAPATIELKKSSPP